MVSQDNNLDFLELVNVKWYQKQFGMRWFIALRQSFLVVVSSIWIFIPHGYYSGSVILVPVFCVVIGASLSSWTMIANASALALSSCIAVLFSFIITEIVPDRVFWVNFILIAVFIFIFASMSSTPRRWIHITTVRKILVDISVCLFFTQSMTTSEKITLYGEQIICALYLVSSVVLVNIFMPSLASRMFIVNVEKNMRWIKLYYRGLSSKLVHDSVEAANSNTDMASGSCKIDRIWLSKLPLSSQKFHSANLSQRSQTIFIVDHVILENNLSNDQLDEIEERLSRELITLTTLFTETRQEKWNIHFLPHYDRLLASLEMNFKQLMSLKHAISKGFNHITSRKIIGPMTPSLNLIVEEVYHQFLLMIDILKDGYKRSDIDNSTTESRINKPTQLDISLHATEETIRFSKESYHQWIEAYQSENSAAHYDDISRAQFCLNNVLNIANSQRSLANIIYDINEKRCSYPIQIEILIYGGWFILSSFPLYLYSIYTYFATKQSNNCTISSKITKLFKDTFINNKRWHFPLQLTVAYITCLVPFYYLDGREISSNFQIKSIWVVISVSLVMAPSIGATLSRFLHRFFGTIVGAALGLAVSDIVKEIPNHVPAREAVLLFASFIWSIPCSFLQQVPQYSYAGSVSSFTYIIIVYGPYQSGVFNPLNAVVRTFMLVIGLISILLATYIIFPIYTYRASRPNIYKISHNMVRTFCDIVNELLKLNSTPDLNETIINVSEDSTKKQISSRIRDIRSSLNRERGLTWDIRSELMFRYGRHYHFSYYVNAINSLYHLYTALVAIESSLNNPFSSQLLQLVGEIGEPIKSIMTNTLNMDQQLQEYFASNKRRPFQSEIQEFETKIAKFDKDIKTFSIPLIHGSSRSLISSASNTKVTTDATERTQLGSTIFNMIEFIHLYKSSVQHVVSLYCSKQQKI